MTVNVVNPDNAALQQAEGNWMKFCALIVWKLAPKGVHITSADIERFAANGGLLLTHGHRDSFEFKIVTPAEAVRIAEHDAVTQRGRA